MKEHPLPKGSFEVHAPLLNEVNDAPHVGLQANGEAHERCIVVQFSPDQNRENIMHEQKYRN